MRLLALSLKNATVKWWRSLTLGLLIFLISFVMVLFNSFSLSIKSMVENVIIRGITGHIQIRSEKSFEADMVGQNNSGYNMLENISSPVVNSIKSVLQAHYPHVEYSELVRRSAFLKIGNKREQTMLIGMDPSNVRYQEAFLLSSGRYLDPPGNHEILLTEEQAKYFNVGTGDTIHIRMKNRYGSSTYVEMDVVGIGTFTLLSLFSYKACYVDLRDLQELIRLQRDEVTDIILFTPHKEEAGELIREMAASFENAGIETIITEDEKMTGDDLKLKILPHLEEKKKEKIKISHYGEMGEVFRGVGESIYVLLNILLVFLMIVASFLIVNLVYMMGIERYREIGTLRAIGFSKMILVKIFMTEILSIAFVFGLLGTLTSSIFVIILGRKGIPSPVPALDYIMGRTLFLEINGFQIILTLIIIFGFSFLASFYPAYKACLLKPAETLRMT
jgi:ABC-type lipoprotein release transport system permease subunit